MVPEIEKLTKKYLIAPTFITIGEVGGGKKDIEQHVYLINESQKNDELGKILRGLPGPIIVFVNTRIKCEKICTLI
jgi:ATP-dependent RNA helicase DDX23/PRP28